jgi:2-keto-4-pentenoate hydratase/2-oxohepta-3-ene-1,7-dioic acid hydratase in catechol pathway
MKIVCIGRNYAEHAKELNNPLPSEPVIFFKPESALSNFRQPYKIPDFTNDLHHEIEVALRINQTATKVDAKDAWNYIDGITLAIDFTARDLQSNLKEKGLPWEKAKAFDGSAILGEWQEVSDHNKKAISFRLLKNGATVQSGNSKDMLFQIPILIEQITKYFTLFPGDVVLTGTPSGVGKVNSGDILEAFFEEELVFTLNII